MLRNAISKIKGFVMSVLTVFVQKIMESLDITTKEDLILFLFKTGFSSYGAISFFGGIAGYGGFFLANLILVICGVTFMYASWVIKANPHCKDIPTGKFFASMSAAALASAAAISLKFTTSSIIAAFVIPTVVWLVGSKLVNAHFEETSGDDTND